MPQEGTGIEQLWNDATLPELPDIASYLGGDQASAAAEVRLCTAARRFETSIRTWLTAGSPAGRWHAASSTVGRSACAISCDRSLGSVRSWADSC